MRLAYDTTLGGNNQNSQDMDITQVDLGYRNGPTGAFGDSASTCAKSCIQEANTPYSNTGWDQLGSSSEVLMGSELSVNQRPGCRESQQPTLSARVWPIDQGKSLPPLFCTHLTAPSSDLLWQEKHQRTELVQAVGKAEASKHQAEVKRLRDWGVFSLEKGQLQRDAAAACPYLQGSSWDDCQALCKGWRGRRMRENRSWNKFRLNIKEKNSPWGQACGGTN